MNFIKNVFRKKIDDFTHRCFVRYSRGDFEKEMLKITKTRNAIKLNGGFEYVTAFHRFMATIVDHNVHLIGNIVTSRDIESDLSEIGIELKEKKPQRGKAGYQYELDCEITPKKYLELTQKCFDCFLLLHMNSGSRSISVKKTKPPKLSKLIENFTRAVFDLADLPKVKNEFLFDIDTNEFRKIEIKHIYHITDIQIPKSVQDDSKMARLNAKRKGTIERRINIDGKEIKKEYPLEA